MTLIAVGPNNQDRVESKLTLKLKIDKNVSKLVNIDKKGSFFLGGTCWYLWVLVGTCWYLLVLVGTCWYLLASVGTCWHLLVPVGVIYHEPPKTSFKNFALRTD